ncbi:MAG: hypothetical protein HFE04_01185 [Bacilli bacterium]|nr:hypothetical protein [Bacilli bacterium]
MENESLKEMLLDIKPGDYEKINKHIITEKDIEDFYQLYSEFLKEDKEYHHIILGRKEKAQELLGKLKILKNMCKLITREIDRHNEHLENSTDELEYAHIKDKMKALEILKLLASTNEEKYEIVKINFPAYDSIERHGTRDSINYNGEIIILAEENTILGYDFSNKNKCLQKSTLIEIYNKGYSIVVVSNDECKTNLPFPKITIGNYHPIIFYLQNDELAKAAYQFIKYIEENGPDIEQIEISELIKEINKKYKKTLTF